MQVKELFSLEGKIAVVTGAAGLIGFHHCNALAMAGANIIACDLDKVKLDELSEKLFPNSIGMVCDVTDKKSLVSVKEQIIRKYGKIDVLVNNAAINDMVENPIKAAEESKFENYPLDLFKKVMETNVTGVFLSSQVFGTEMALKGLGSIINIASTYGIVAPNQSIYINESNEQTFYKSPVYPASKGAVISFTRYLAAYWGKSGVRVNVLSPGGVENNQNEFFIKKYSEMTPLNRMAKADDYMGALIYLASDASAYMTGANLVVDGGWTIW